MPSDELTFRIRCIYAAIGNIEETNLENYSPKVERNGNKVTVYQDWSGGLSDEQRTNYIETIINNIASFEYYLNKWADNNNHDKNKIKATFESSKALNIIHDLWNNVKHAGSSRNSKSGLFPIIDNINSTMQMTTKPEKGSYTNLTFNRQGVPIVSGDGDAKVIITGDILDKDGNKIGDLYDTLLKGIKDWEKVLREFGLLIESD